MSAVKKSAELLQFPKQEQKVMTDKEEGFTPMPNFICDEGYLAALGGDAFKCLYFMNRHIKGFHLENKSMGEALLIKITGIKDKRTIRKCTAELEKFGLIKIEKSNGKSHSYTLTYDERLPIKPVASNVPSTSNAVTCHATTPVTSHATATSDTACHSVKEIYLKENTKTKEEEERANFQAQRRPLNFIEYHTQDRTAVSFKNLCQKYSVERDFIAQAKISFPHHTEQQIQETLADLAQWSLSASNFMPQKWMSIWLKFINRELIAKEKQVAKNKNNNYQPTATKHSKTMQNHDDFFAQYGIGSAKQESDFIDGYSSEIKTIEGDKQ